ncbi:MAG TPA: glycosyltransferase, partial [Candidatus Synoicihabitans sp.]|nr:glycosyltransferase [Candidatus Synoicihabitans sp.]
MAFIRWLRVLDWITPGGLRRPLVLTDRGLSWQIERPATGPFGVTTRTLVWHGHLRATRSGALPVDVYVGRPKRRQHVGTLSAPDADGRRRFSVAFISSAGLKLYRLYLRWNDGSETLLGWRLLWCRRKVEHIPPQLVLQPHPPEPAEIRLPQATEPEVSIIVPIYNQTALTLKCLGAVARHTAGPSYEVIVIDDASPEPEVVRLGQIQHLRLLRNSCNQGFLQSCNRGAETAVGRYLVFLNNDTEVQPGWLEALVNLARERRDTGLVGAKLIHPDGRLQEAGGIVWNDGSAANYGKNRPPFDPAFNYVKEVDYCSGA